MLGITHERLIDILLTAPPLLLSLTLHEYAHARMALAFGDPTAKHNGRVTLNPLRHLDPVGTLMLLFSGVMGWAKPVPVNPYNLHPRRLGDIMVSLAGPLTNFLLAVVAAMLLRAWVAWGLQGHTVDPTVRLLLYYTAIANLGLCFFNLLPLFPLDGHHIARELLPPGKQQGFMRWQLQFGSFILMALIIGPHVIEAVTRRPIRYDPISLFLGKAIFPLLKVLTGLGPAAVFA